MRLARIASGTVPIFEDENRDSPSTADRYFRKSLQPFGDIYGRMVPSASIS
jgi:hypothetical protein